MADNSEKLILEEKAKRKELSRVRIFWFLAIANVVLVIYIILQIVILIGQH
ncbi:MAG: hypothetical protein K5925_02435 [Bacilli bacterium]|nr:hypothetical protein [Bacilli bacterium]